MVREVSFKQAGLFLGGRGGSQTLFWDPNGQKWGFGGPWGSQNGVLGSPWGPKMGFWTSKNINRKQVYLYGYQCTRVKGFWWHQVSFLGVLRGPILTPGQVPRKGPPGPGGRGYLGVPKATIYVAYCDIVSCPWFQSSKMKKCHILTLRELIKTLSSLKQVLNIQVSVNTNICTYCTFLQPMFYVSQPLRNMVNMVPN